jgi:hypothetical protein
LLLEPHERFGTLGRELDARPALLHSSPSPTKHLEVCVCVCVCGCGTRLVKNTEKRAAQKQTATITGPNARTKRNAKVPPRKKKTAGALGTVWNCLRETRSADSVAQTSLS